MLGCCLLILLIVLLIDPNGCDAMLVCILGLRAVMCSLEAFFITQELNEQRKCVWNLAFVDSSGM